MDYGGGSILRKYQWDLIHHPRIIIPWLQDEEGAKLHNIDMDNNSIKLFLQQIKDANIEDDDILDISALNGDKGAANDLLL